MSVGKSLRLLGIAAVMSVLTAAPAQAQGVEIGTSLASVTFDVEGDGTAILGVPSGGFGILSPTLYASLVLGEKFAIEPQLGLIVVTGGGETSHFLNFNAQADYFLAGTTKNSLYLFGGGGLIHINDVGGTLKSISAGAGYRMVLGDRLTMRLHGRYTHFTDSGGNAVAFTVSLGGMFGR